MSRRSRRRPAPEAALRRGPVASASRSAADRTRDPLAELVGDDWRPRRRFRWRLRPPRGEHAVGRGAVVARFSRRLVLPVVLVGLTVGIMVIGVFPTRTWLDQRAAVSSAQRELAELNADNEQRRARVAALQTDAEIERIAREEHGFAKVGEEVYHVLPPAEDPVRVPEAWPFTRVAP
jgi:cell division protein FtsB